ncbi:hypothetical protein Q8A73_013731 [Channa argus]|nr:hypothetical protein Q8A73_013731 [Channa argus]
MAAENKPEGLKKVRNPDRMYRSAVCYAGHGPPKSISDDTEMNNEHGHLKIYLPKKLLECLPKCTSLPKERHRWNTNEEIAAYLITFEKHEEWLTTSPKTSACSQGQQGKMGGRHRQRGYAQRGAALHADIAPEDPVLHCFHPVNNPDKDSYAHLGLSELGEIKPTGENREDRSEVNPESTS